MTLSGFLHWLVSQSVFVIQTVAYTVPDFSPHKELDASSIGYSSISIVFAAATGITLLLALCFFGFALKYKAKAPKYGGKMPPYPMPWRVRAARLLVRIAMHTIRL
jgi:hypothetical protein